MRFSGEVVTKEQIRTSLLSCLIVYSIALPITVTFLAVHVEPYRKPYFLAAAACITVPLAYLIAQVVRGSLRGFLDLNPMLVFVIGWFGYIALGFIEYAAGYNTGMYDAGFFVGVALASVLGDRGLRALTSLLCLAVVAVVRVSLGMRGEQLVALLVVDAWAFFSLNWLIGRTFHSLHSLVDSRTGLRAITEATADADSVAEALAAALPLIRTVVPTDHAVVFAAPPGGSPSPVQAWPAAADGDRVLAQADGYRTAVEDDVVVYRDSHAFLPIGYDELGAKLVLVIHRPRGRGENDLLITESAYQVAGTFLRTIARAVHVAGLAHETRTDVLTALPNRRALLERLRVEMERAARGQRALAVAMVDLDRFKEFNDAHGHVAGDAMLQQMARLLATSVRGQDLVARYGGEEFCVVMPDTDVAGAYVLMDRIRTKAEEPAGTPSADAGGVTYSVGVTQWNWSETATEVIERADLALYTAKERGRNRVETLDPSDT